MIPIRDNQPTATVPVATYGLIAVNLLVFMLQLQAGMGNQTVFYQYGLVPGKYTVWEVSRHFTLFNHMVSVFTYMFLHGGGWHLVGNMWFLYIFGDNIEAHLGSARYLGFYLICGLVAGLFHFLLNPTSVVPTIGASGAIAGVMGAYFLLFPGARILTLVPILIVPMFFQIPAFVFLGIWFLMQFLNAAGSGSGSGIAWWAHVGGFVAGLILMKVSNRLPSMGAGERIKKYTRKKHSPRLQVIVPQSRGKGGDLHGKIEVSSLEAMVGTKKMITIPWGFYRPLYRLSVPPGIRQGTKLRLAGMGRSLPGMEKGDLFLSVQIKNVI